MLKTLQNPIRQYVLFMTAILLLISLSGCSSVQGFLEQGAAELADAADASLKNGEFMMCDGATYGAVMRKFKTVEERRMRHNFCWPDTPFEEDPDNP